MNQENYEFLKNQVKYSGFGEGLDEVLKESIQKQQPEFTLNASHTFGKDDVTAKLYFRKPEGSDHYFFNKYDISAGSEFDATNAQTFYIGKENNFTLKEAFNLISGRAVNKDMINREQQPYNAWVQLDFHNTDDNGKFKMKYFNENYGYDLNDAISKHPLKELENPEEKASLIESLKKGNRQSVTFVFDGVEKKQYLAANPQYKSVTVYDSNFKRVFQGQKEGAQNKTSNRRNKSENQSAANDGEQGEKPKRVRKQAH
jgi:hypothetical protein